MSRWIVALMLVGCSGEFSSREVSDAGDELATGGALATGGSNATGGVLATAGSNATGGVLATAGNNATGGALATGGSNATGGALATGGSNATGGALATGGSNMTGGALATGGTTACIKRTTCIAGASAATITDVRNYVAIQCNANVYWCSSAGCTLATSAVDMIVCVKGPCNYPFTCTNECTNVSYQLTCSCGQNGVVACM